MPGYRTVNPPNPCACGHANFAHSATRCGECFAINGAGADHAFVTPPPVYPAYLGTQP